MLINTVVLFLRDTLPIFLLISVLLALPRVSTLAVAWRVLLLVLLAVFTYPQLGLVSQLSEGAGFEYLKSILFFIAWLGMCLVVLLPSRMSNRFSLGLTLLVIGIGLPNSLHFLVYFVSELSRNSDSTLLLLGTIIGLGISISIAILLNILLT
ncbi:MAG: FTR1 family iron permease, partial [Pseudomonadota bacterium]|nr:FTR1 family iron permease [Pseudomonadota bacterium]